MSQNQQTCFFPRATLKKTQITLRCLETDPHERDRQPPARLAGREGRGYETGQVRGDVGTWPHAARFVPAIWDAHSPAGPAVTSLLGDLAAVAETFQRYRRATYMHDVTQVARLLVRPGGGGRP